MEEAKPVDWSRVSEEVWEVVSTFHAYILDERVSITTSKLVTGGTAFRFVTRATHGIISDTQATPYQSMHAQVTAEQSLQDWIRGIQMFMGQPNARMVKS